MSEQMEEQMAQFLVSFHDYSQPPICDIIRRFATNGQELSRIVKNFDEACALSNIVMTHELPLIVKYCHELSRIGKNCHSLSSILTNCQKIITNCQELAQIIKKIANIKRFCVIMAIA